MKECCIPSYCIGKASKLVIKSNISTLTKQQAKHITYCIHNCEYPEFMCMFLPLPPPSVHQNYVGTDAEKNPFYLSVVLSDQNNQRVPQYRAILWRKTVSTHTRTHTDPLLK